MDDDGVDVVVRQQIICRVEDLNKKIREVYCQICEQIRNIRNLLQLFVQTQEMTSTSNHAIKQ